MNLPRIGFSLLALYLAVSLQTCQAGIVFKHTFDGSVNNTRFTDGTNGAEQVATGVTSKATRVSSYGAVSGTDEVITPTGSTDSFANSYVDFSLETTSSFTLQSFSFDISKLGGGSVVSYYRLSLRDGTSVEYLSGSSTTQTSFNDTTPSTKTFSLTSLSAVSNSVTSSSPALTFRLELAVDGTGTPDRRIAFDNVTLLSVDSSTVPEPSSFVAFAFLSSALLTRRRRRQVSFSTIG